MLRAETTRGDLCRKHFRLPMRVEEATGSIVAEGLLRDVIHRALQRIPFRDLREALVVVVEELPLKGFLRGLEGDGPEGHRELGLELVIAFGFRRRLDEARRGYDTREAANDRSGVVSAVLAKGPEEAMAEGDVQRLEGRLPARQEVPHHREVTVGIVEDRGDPFRWFLKEPCLELRLTVCRFKGLEGTSQVSNPRRRNRSRERFEIATVVHEELVSDFTMQPVDLPEERRDLLETQGGGGRIPIEIDLARKIPCRSAATARSLV